MYKFELNYKVFGNRADKYNIGLAVLTLAA